MFLDGGGRKRYNVRKEILEMMIKGIMLRKKGKREILNVYGGWIEIIWGITLNIL